MTEIENVFAGTRRRKLDWARASEQSSARVWNKKPPRGQAWRL